MSVNAMRIVWKHYPYGGSDMLVALALADFCDDKGLSLHPSIRTIARKGRLSECRARRIVHRMVHEGFLEVIGNEFGGDPGMSRQYRLRLDMLEQIERSVKNGSATPGADATPSEDATPVADARYPCRGRHVTPSAGANQTTIYPSLTTNDSGELDRQAAPPADAPLPIICILLKDGSEYGIPAKQIAEWSEIYPAVDVPQQLRAMREWCISNPRKRKTACGVRGFITGWLARKQDKRSRPPTLSRDESRRHAYEVLTGKTAASQPEPGVIDGNVKLIR